MPMPFPSKIVTLSFYEKVTERKYSACLTQECPTNFLYAFFPALQSPSFFEEDEEDDLVDDLDDMLLFAIDFYSLFATGLLFSSLARLNVDFSKSF